MSIKTLALVGNPNVGKSVVFNFLTGRYTTVSNYPGTTVDIPEGEFHGVKVLDSPGVYGFSAMNEEEKVAEEAVMRADFLVNVVSAITLGRDLFLTQQLIDHGKKLVLLINQYDEALAQGLTIDTQKLEKFLGVPVLTSVATTGEGLHGLSLVLEKWLNQPESIPLGNATPNSPGPEEMRRLESNPARRMQVYGSRRQHINGLILATVAQKSEETHTRNWRTNLSRQVGRVLLNPVVGGLSLIFALMALYQVVGVWVAGDLVALTEETIMLGYVVPWIQKALAIVFPVGSTMYNLLGGEFGVLTMSLQYIFGVLFPLVLGFYIYISILEDCGYMPRIAVLSDAFLNRLGLNGRAIIPMILGLGCVTMATVSTRVLSSQRERTIASTLLAIAVPCSAQLGVIIGLMAKHSGFKGWLWYILILLTVFVAIGTALNKILPGKSTALVLDLPPIRLPKLSHIAQKTWVRTVVFLKEASPLFMLGSLIVGVFQVFGWLAAIQGALAPLVVNFLHLPAQAANAFVMGMVRRDFGAAGLYFLSDQLDLIQILTALTVITLFVPCIASATVMNKERGNTESTLVLLGSWLLAFAVGGLVCRLLAVLPHAWVS